MCDILFVYEGFQNNGSNVAECFRGIERVIVAPKGEPKAASDTKSADCIFAEDESQMLTMGKSQNATDTYKTDLTRPKLQKRKMPLITSWSSIYYMPLFKLKLML